MQPILPANSFLFRSQRDRLPVLLKNGAMCPSEIPVTLAGSVNGGGCSMWGVLEIHSAAVAVGCSVEASGLPP